MKKIGLKYKILLSIFMVILVSMGVLFIVDTYVIGTPSFFTKTFLIPICLASIGVIALLLSMSSQKSLSGDNKGDSMMIIVGFALIIIAIFTLMMSLMA